MKTKQEQILKILMGGGVVQEKDHLYKLVDKQLCVKYAKLNLDKKDEDKVEFIWMPIDISFDGFLDWCENFSDEEIFFMNANIALQKHHEDKRKESK